jgi:L-malate glycosyltransferase
VRVLHYCSRGWSAFGGAERQLGRLVEWQLGHGYDVGLMTAQPFAQEDVKVYSLGTDCGRAKGGLLCMMRRGFSAVLSRRREYDIVHVHGAGPLACAVAVGARLGGLRVVTSLRSSGANADIQHVLRDHGRVVGRAVWRLQVAASNRLVVKSRRMREELARGRISPKKLAMVPNGIDTVAYSRVPDVDGAGSEFLYLGRYLVETKGLDVLADAWKRYVISCPDSMWTLRLVGDGPDRASVVDLFDGLTRVSVDGAVSDVRDVLSACSVVILSSRVEGFSNTLLEAMAAGRPIISSAVSASEDIVDSSMGRLVPVADAQALALALAEVSFARNEERISMGAHSRCNAQNFDMGVVASQWDALYAEVRLD